MLVSVISALAFAGFAAAQAGTVVTISVGGPTSGPFIYTPNTVTAANGTVVQFTWSGAPGNHSVTQSTFASPCEPIADGFDTGTIFIPAGTGGGFPTWNLTITNDSHPIWFYCKQLAPGPHCNMGMVGAINAPTSGTNTFQAFQAAAEAHTGESGQSIGFLVGQGASASAPPGPFSGSITGFGVPTATGPSGSSATGTTTTSSSSTATSSSAARDLTIPAGSFAAVLAALFGVVLV